MSSLLELSIFLRYAKVALELGKEKGGARRGGGGAQLLRTQEREPKVVRAGQSFPVLGLWM